MEHLASTSQNAEIKGRAKYTAAAMKEIDFLAFCHFLADVFSILETISLKFSRMISFCLLQFLCYEKHTLGYLCWQNMLPLVVG